MSERMSSGAPGGDANENPGARPIRLRGYYRAVKRGDAWAVKIASLLKRDKLAGLLALCYRNVDFKELMSLSNPFLKLVDKSTGSNYWGAVIQIPFKPKE